MQEILYEYQMNPTTWVYLSSLIMIAVYFKFRRFWSVRNLDLIGLILVCAGLLLVSHGSGNEGFRRPSRPPRRKRKFTNPRRSARLNCRPMRGRRHVQPPRPRARKKPRTGKRKRKIARIGPAVRTTGLLVALRRERFFPLSHAGRFGHGAAAASGTQPLGQRSDVRLRGDAGLSDVERHHPRTEPSPRPPDLAGRSSRQSRVADENADVREILKQRGPGYPLFHVFSSESDEPGKRATAILAHLAVVLGMVLIGYRHFDNTHTGIAAATLYLLLPYTADFTPRIDHVVPAALLVWAIQSTAGP